MYKFKKLNNGQKTPSPADIEDFVSVVKLCEKFKHQLFDDFRFTDGEKFSAKELMEAVAALIEEAGKYFWVVKTKIGNKFVGFVYLYDLIGGKNALYSAVIGTCVEKSFWGYTTLILSRKFLNYCFKKLGFKKLKCETFHSNPFIMGILKKLGFRLEGVAIAETIVRGKSENLLKWAIEAKDWLQNSPQTATKATAAADSEFLNTITGLINSAQEHAKNPAEEQNIPWTKKNKKKRTKKEAEIADIDADSAPDAPVKKAKKKGAEPLDYTSRSINNVKIIPIFRKKGKDC